MACWPFMDNLAAHKVQGVRQPIEAEGAELRYLPPCSPDLDPSNVSRPRRAKTPSPSWRHCSERPPSAPSRAFGSRSASCSTASRQPNARTTSRMWDRYGQRENALVRRCAPRSAVALPTLQRCRATPFSPLRVPVPVATRSIRSSTRASGPLSSRISAGRGVRLPPPLRPAPCSCPTSAEPKRRCAAGSAVAEDAIVARNEVCRSLLAATTGHCAGSRRPATRRRRGHERPAPEAAAAAGQWQRQDNRRHRRGCCRRRLSAAVAPRRSPSAHRA